MKKNIKSLISSMFVLLLSINPVSAATTIEIETVFNWAENNFPELFPNHQMTQIIDPWAFRFYPSTGIYTGVKNDEVFVLGGPWGLESPTLVGTMPNVLAQIQDINGTVPACGNVELPPGVVVTQSGNTVNITTNGQCIGISGPENANFCKPPAPTAQTGISVLSTTDITSFEASGVTIELPGLPNPLATFSQGASNCIINAQPEMANTVVNMDACFDVTNEFSDLSGLPGVTVTPPITVSMASTRASQQVPDCFDTNARTIFDAFTEETWVNNNGNFIPISPGSDF